MEYFVLVIGWVIYYALHSLLASRRIKAAVGLKPTRYRLMYVVFATIGFLLLLFFNGSIGGDYILTKTRFITYAALILAGIGVVVARMAFRNLSAAGFLGLADEPEGDLITEGIYSIVRHPLYTATILITLGFFLYDSRPATAISVGITWLYLIPGIWLEEKKLIAVFGSEYEEYRHRVAAIIPFLL